MSDIFQALAHPVRRQILHLLSKRPMSAGALSEEFELSKPTMSGHFAVLKSAGLIAAERKGTVINYRLNLSVVEEALTVLMQIANVGHSPKKETAPWKLARR